MTELAPWLTPEEPTDTAPWEATTSSSSSQDRSWSDVPLEAVKNIPSSALQFGKNLVQPIIHPIETAETLGNIFTGVGQYADKLGTFSPPALLTGSLGRRAVSALTGHPVEDKKPYVDAVGQFLVDRYGSMDALKKTLAEDPVGVIADISTVLTAGGAAPVRGADVVGKVGRAMDPINAVTKTIPPAARFAAPYLAEGVGAPPGVGGAAISEAAQAGFEGGARGEQFRQHMRGNVPMEDAVTDATRAIKEMREERNIDYNIGKQIMGMNQAVLPNWTSIDSAIANLRGVKMYKGQDLSPSTAAIRDDLDDIIIDWKMLPPKDFHTPEGLDALKQKIGDIRDATKYGTPERKVADGYYHAVRNAITRLDSNYAKVMRGYEQATDLLKEIDQTLAVSPEKGKRSIDTSLRRLQSVLRNNVNTNFGQREKLLEFLISTKAAPHLKAALAGQAMNSLAPRGMMRTATTAGMLATLGAALAGSPQALMALGLLPATSPRVVGEAAHAAGRMARPLPATGRIAKKASMPAFQAGRIANEIEEEEEE